MNRYFINFNVFLSDKMSSLFVKTKRKQRRLGIHGTRRCVAAVLQYTAN